MIVDPDCYIGTTVNVWEGIQTASSLTVFPNPASPELKVAYTSTKNFDAQFAQPGWCTHQQQTDQGAIRQKSLYYLDVSSLPPATYFVRIENKTSGEAKVSKLIKA
ncbi:MAG: hypothetical protein R2778_12705 [Saprospiraceae bacterium]